MLCSLQSKQDIHCQNDELAKSLAKSVTKRTRKAGSLRTHVPAAVAAVYHAALDYFKNRIKISTDKMFQIKLALVTFMAAVPSTICLVQFNWWNHISKSLLITSKLFLCAYEHNVVIDTEKKDLEEMVQKITSVLSSLNPTVVIPMIYTDLHLSIFKWEKYIILHMRYIWGN